jgi:hypothetical protein
MSEEYEMTKVIAEYVSEGEALAAQAALRAAGIEAQLTNDNATYFSLFGRLQFAPIRLAVPASRMGAAMLVLARFDEPAEEGWEEIAEGAIDGWLCSACDSVTADEETTCIGCGAPRRELQDGDELAEEDE